MKIGIIILLIVSIPVESTAQSNSPHHKKSYFVKLWLTDGSTTSGIWMGCTDSTLTISHLNDSASITTYNPEEIYKLEIRKLNSMKRNALIGAGVGFIIGFAIGWDEFQSDMSPTKSQREHAIGAGILGSFVGGFVGFLSGAIGKTYFIFGNLEQYNRIRPELTKYRISY